MAKRRASKRQEQGQGLQEQDCVDGGGGGGVGKAGSTTILFSVCGLITIRGALMHGLVSVGSSNMGDFVAVRVVEKHGVQVPDGDDGGCLDRILASQGLKRGERKLDTTDLIGRGGRWITAVLPCVVSLQEQSSRGADKPSEAAAESAVHAGESKW